MFSFHKPKIYRSIAGCCICRAKSSSSRFTDSKRYELDFGKCFQIMERRSGEICNACVLLVKRWKKLPAGSNRNWHHVVDARAGPGTKSMNKIKNKAKMEEKLLKKKHKHKHKKPKMIVKAPQSPGGLSDDIIDDFLSDRSSHSGYLSEASDDERTSRKSGRRRKNANPHRFSSFLDLTYWKKTEICCGIIFKGANGEVMVDTSLLRPCACRTKHNQQQKQSQTTATSTTTTSTAAPHTLTRQDSAECMDDDDDIIDDDEEASDSGIGSQETSPDTTPPDSQACTPLDTKPPYPLPTNSMEREATVYLSGIPTTSSSRDWLSTHTSAEVATAAAVLDLSVPKMDDDGISTPSRMSPDAMEHSIAAALGGNTDAVDLLLPSLDQHSQRCIEMEV